MKLSKEAMDEFKQIYKKEFGEDLNNEEILDLATQLITLFQVTYRPKYQMKIRKRYKS